MCISGGLNGLSDKVDLGGNKAVWISSLCNDICCVILSTLNRKLPEEYFLTIKSVYLS